MNFIGSTVAFREYPENITYSANSKEGKVEGKTIITVFEPSVEMEVKNKTPHIDLWPVSGGQVCRLYLGDRSKLPKDRDLPKKLTSDEEAKQINKKAAKDAAGIFIDSTVTLPKPFSNQNHSLEYIQLIKELILETRDVTRISALERITGFATKITLTLIKWRRKNHLYGR